MFHNQPLHEECPRLATLVYWTLASSVCILVASIGYLVSVLS